MVNRVVASLWPNTFFSASPTEENIAAARSLPHTARIADVQMPARVALVPPPR
jgi:hypothetical protein